MTPTLTGIMLLATIKQPKLGATMSRKKKLGQKGKPQATTSPTQQVNHPAKSPQTPPNPSTEPSKENLSRNEQRQWIGIKASIAIGLLGCFGSMFSIVIAYQSKEYTKEVNDRMTGRTQAKVSIEKIVQAPRQITDKMKVFRKSENGAITTMLHVKSVDDVALLNPVIGVRNDGEEIVDAVKIDVRVVEIKTIYPPDAKMPNPEDVTHIIGRQSASVEHTIDGKLSKGDVARISIIKVLLQHILDCKNPKVDDKALPQEAEFLITCYGRLSNATGYDGPKDDTNKVFLRLSWNQTGFSEELVKAKLDAFQATPQVIRARR